MPRICIYTYVHTHTQTHTYTKHARTIHHGTSIAVCHGIHVSIHMYLHTHKASTYVRNTHTPFIMAKRLPCAAATESTSVTARRALTLCRSASLMFMRFTTMAKSWCNSGSLRACCRRANTKIHTHTSIHTYKSQSGATTTVCVACLL